MGVDDGVEWGIGPRANLVGNLLAVVVGPGVEDDETLGAVPRDGMAERLDDGQVGCQFGDLVDDPIDRLVDDAGVDDLRGE